MYEDTMPSGLDKAYLSNSLNELSYMDEQLDFHPEDSDKGDSLSRRIASVAEELVDQAIRPQIFSKLQSDPTLWESLDERQRAIARVVAFDVGLESVRFLVESYRDFVNFFSNWKGLDFKGEYSIKGGTFKFAQHISSLGISVKTEGAGANWSQYRPTTRDLKSLAVLAAAMEPAWGSDADFAESISGRRTFKSFYFGNQFFNLLEAHYQRDVRDEWFFYRLQECDQLIHYAFQICDKDLIAFERKRLADLKPLQYKYPRP